MLTIGEVAKLTSLSIQTLRHLTRQGKFPHYRVGRRVFYSQEQIAQFLEKHEVRS